MSAENVEIVRRTYEAYMSGDLEAALAVFDPDVVFDVSIRPEGEVYHGPQGVADAMRTWTGTWEGFRMEVEELIEAGEHVIGVEHQSGRGRGSGLPLSETYFTVWELEAGKVTRITWLRSRAEALKAAGV